MKGVDVPETVYGLPLHPLVVHAAIVLIPVTALLAVIISLSQDRRTRWGVLTWILATAAWAATIAAKFSGENLETSLYPDVTPLVTAQHADYGSSSVWFGLALWLSVSAVVLLDLDRRRRDGFGSPLLPTIVAVLTIVAAMAATGQVLLTAWTGADARWG
jgi:glucan phosphoethanolaminetransferase (alkaline phosphatase superfamily)